tara:strand:+ start:2413 stop:3633 length:1221 start_codon:yes stop_codon:yes gene_type:complete
MVPENWSATTLGAITKESAFGPRFSSDLYSVDGNVGTIRTTDLDDEGNINYDTIPYASLPSGFESHYLDDGDLLITRSGSCGIPCIFESQDKPIVAGAFLIRFVLKENTDVKYVHALLKSDKLQRKIQNLASGGVQKNLSGTNLKKLEFVLPPLPEQKKIAQILSTWDQAITATERLLENSQQRKKGLMQQLLTGKKRLPGFEGEWETTKVGKICKLGAGQSAPQGEDFFDKGIHDFLRVSDIGSSAGRFAPVSRDKINDRAVQEKRLSKVPAGATVFTKSGASLLLNQRAQLKTDTYIVSHLGFALGTELSDDDFIYYLFCLIDFGKIAAGTSLPALQLSTLSQIKVTVPTQKQEQNAIAQILGVADQEIERIRKRLLLLKQEKQALMQQLLTGKRRVQVDTEAA